MSRSRLRLYFISGGQNLCFTVMERKGKTRKIFSKAAAAVLTAVLLALICAGVYSCAEKKYIYPIDYETEVFTYADAYGLPRALVFSVIKAESGFDKNARSSAGAMGLMQIKEPTGAYIARKTGIYKYDLYDPDTNIHFGCFYLKYLLSRFGNVRTALAAYNAGEGNAAAWLKDERCSEDGKTLKFIPFAETREYVRKIERSFVKYKKLYGKLLDK